MNPQPKICKHCKFWTPWPKQPNSEMVVGDCRRHAPQIFQTDPPQQSWSGKDDKKHKPFVTKFPSTQSTEFCGSFKVRPFELDDKFFAWWRELQKIAEPVCGEVNEADWIEAYGRGLTPQAALGEHVSETAF